MTRMLLHLTTALALAATLVAPCAQAGVSIAPSWRLKTPEGKTVSYPADHKGQPLVLLFWPSWCPYSRALQPYVQDIRKDYGEKGVAVWTINIRETGDPVRALRERGLSLPLLLKGDGLIPTYGIERTPWFVVIDAQRNIVYTRPADAPSPIDVANNARLALNRILGPQAVPLPTSYPPPYDLHLRKPGAEQQAGDLASDSEWRAWAERYLAEIGPEERVTNQRPRGPVVDGKTAISLARETWTRTYGAEATTNQTPYRAFRRNELWLVAGRAVSGQLGQGFIFVVQADTGQVVRLRGDTTLQMP